MILDFLFTLFFTISFWSDLIFRYENINVKRQKGEEEEGTKDTKLFSYTDNININIESSLG